ncbi:MAG: acyl-CoA synthetase FdrA [Pseudomonas sp.]
MSTEPVRRISLRQHEYYDSVRLMQVSAALRRLPGIREAILMMATPNNRKILDGVGLLVAEVANAAADDLVVGLVADDEASAEHALRTALEQLARRSSTGQGQQRYRSMDAAVEGLAGANLALISVPGAYAAAEARHALERGLHVMLFSDNVTLEEERALKQLAGERGLLMMGPDCGTAIIDGIGLGFSNTVRPGRVGIVGASGTGMQAISVYLHQLGLGISQALGTGGRDLKAAIGGLSMLAGLERLAADPDTDVIVLTSKPPSSGVAARVLARAQACDKPVVINFLGQQLDTQAAHLYPAASLEQAADLVASLLGQAPGAAPPSEPPATLRQQARALESGRRCLRGVYSGGTLCYEAFLLLQPRLPELLCNLAGEAERQPGDPWRGQGHCLVDLGDDLYTQNRPHPMIDPGLRTQRIVQEALDPDTGVILLDLVLGHGAHADPAGELAQAIEQARQAVLAEGGTPPLFVAFICGTELDPQPAPQQRSLLEQAGVHVFDRHAHAVQVAGQLIELLESRP